ncbi:NAD(P)/FAD-dependent oxidoreductase [Nonomuraea sp. NPDC048826]|uniref:NAD(P)/FAD-dependent oxidoreductase n=1 Tax=Nonomuraea sp. NPDC048826 TaxID=3364347 RepID=UPI003720F87F
MRVAVIGSGIVGAAAAHWLSGRGVSVTVVDGAYPGQATQAGAGIVCPWVDHPDDDAWYRLTRAGTRYYPELVAALGETMGYARVGALLVADDPADLEPVRALLARRYAEAPEMGEVVDVASPSTLFPPLAEDLSALLVPGAARVDGRAVRSALLRAAVRQGAELRSGTATLTADGGVLVRDVREADSRGSDAPASPGPSDLASWRQATPGPTPYESPAPRPDSPYGPPDGGQAGGTPGSPYGQGGGETRGAGGSPYGPGGEDAGGATGSRGGGAAGASHGPEVGGGAGGAAGSPGGTVGGSRGARDGGGVLYGESEVAVAGGEVGEERPGAVGEGVPLDVDVVIVAAGAWTGEVCRGLGVEVPVFPRRGQIVHATLDDVDTSGWPIVLPHIGPYLVGFPGSRVVVGATIEDVGFAPRVTVGGLDEVLQAGLRVAPGLFGATVSETRVGLRPVYAPGSPLVGPVGERVIVATGMGAYGLTAGPFAGRLAAGLALGEEPPIDVRPYGLRGR